MGSFACFFSCCLDALENVDAHIIYGYVVHDQSTTRNVTLSYPSDKSNEIVTGRAFHHGRFVMGLREQARKCGYVMPLLLMNYMIANLITVQHLQKEQLNHCWKTGKETLLV